MEINYTLLSDGSSDQALIPILNWLISEHVRHIPLNNKWADLGRLRTPPETLVDCIIQGVYYYPCNLLFIHRDAEKFSFEERKKEILSAVAEAKKQIHLMPVICAIPIRMTEAWLLIDEIAIRKASGNPHGNMQLELPRIRDIEDIPDPKNHLYNCLIEASGLSRRRLKKFRPSSRRVAELIEDFSALRGLNAFIQLETELLTVLKEIFEKD